jgi:hypothetical protein
VYGFSVSADDAAFGAYDWSLLTGVGWQRDPARIRLAHSKGSRVELQAQAGVAGIISDPLKRQRWVREARDRGKVLQHIAPCTHLTKRQPRAFQILGVATLNLL